MPSADQSPNDRERLRKLDLVCDQFEAALKSNDRCRVEDFFDPSDISNGSELLRELIGIEIEFRQQSGVPVARNDYLERFPEFPQQVNEVFESTDQTLNLHPDTALLPGQSSRETPQPEGQDSAPVVSGYRILKLLGRGEWERFTAPSSFIPSAGAAPGCSAATAGRDSFMKSC